MINDKILAEGLKTASEQEIKKDTLGKDFDLNDPPVKSPSQRLRGVLFVYWQSLGGNGDFETFYNEKIEVFISHVKSKID